MGEVVNLNKYRKQKAKAEREKRAETNRRLHGRTKVERQREALTKKRLTRNVDGSLLAKPPKPSSDSDTSTSTSEDSD